MRFYIGPHSSSGFPDTHSDSRLVLWFSTLDAHLKNRDARISPLKLVWSGAQASDIYKDLQGVLVFIGVY